MMDEMKYLRRFYDRHDQRLFNRLNTGMFNVLKTCTVIDNMTNEEIHDKVVEEISNDFPDNENMVKFIDSVLKVFKMTNKKRDIFKEIAAEKFNTAIPTEEQITHIKNIKGIYSVDDEPVSSWDEYYYNVTLQVARNSKCLSRKIGAILVRDKVIVGTGYNGPPRGIPSCDLRWLVDEDFTSRYKPEDLSLDDYEQFENKCPRHVLDAASGELLEVCVASHAEENAILSCARGGISTNGTTMYMTCSIPCFKCLIKIINAGVSELVMTGTDVYDNNSVYLLNNSNVKLRLYDFI
jgi:dCMP deaminase